MLFGKVSLFAQEIYKRGKKNFFGITPNWVNCSFLYLSYHHQQLCSVFSNCKNLNSRIEKLKNSQKSSDDFQVKNNGVAKILKKTNLDYWGHAVTL